MASNQPLTFTAEQAGSTLKMSKSSSAWAPDPILVYSTDGGSTWSRFAINVVYTLANIGDTFQLRAETTTTGLGTQMSGVDLYDYFVMTGKIAASGNIMSLYDKDFATTNPQMTLDGFCRTFIGCSSLTSAPELPATTMAEHCYLGMFAGCTSLTAAPELPATTLANGCYNSMFQSCSSLTSAPELPATTLDTACYVFMFQECTSLTQAPELPATSMQSGCYFGMFQGCTSLTQAPELPATTLADSCYNKMFSGCTSLTTAPKLPATTMATGCYNEMFQDCTSLSSVTAAISSTDLNSGTYTGSDQYYYKGWLGGVASGGTFSYLDPDFDPNTVNRGSREIPTGWTIEAAPVPPVRQNELFIGGKRVMTLSIGGKAVKTLFINGRQVVFGGTEPPTPTRTPTRPLSFTNESEDVVVMSFFNADSRTFVADYHLEMAWGSNPGDGDWFYPNPFDDDNPVDIDYIEIPAGGTVNFRCTVDRHVWNDSEDWGEKPRIYWVGGPSGSIRCSGPVTALISRWEYPDGVDIGRYEFAGLFSDDAGGRMVNTPELPSRVVAAHGYDSMFSNCKGIVSTHVGATEMADEFSLVDMFNGCENLSEIKIDYDGDFGHTAINDTFSPMGYNWVEGVASEGTFKYNGTDTANFGPWAIPDGWTVEPWTD